MDDEIVFVVDTALWGKGYDCNGCSLCCMALTVKLSEIDINRLKTGLQEDNVLDHYCNSDRTLNKNEDGCLFREKDRCTIYDYRPNTCRIFPYNFKIDKNVITIGMHELAEYTCFRKIFTCVNIARCLGMMYNGFDISDFYGRYQNYCT